MSIDEPLNYLFILSLPPEPYHCACPRCGHMEAQMEPRHVPHLLHNAQLPASGQWPYHPPVTGAKNLLIFDSFLLTLPATLHQRPSLTASPSPAQLQSTCLFHFFHHYPRVGIITANLYSYNNSQLVPGPLLSPFSTFCITHHFYIHCPSPKHCPSYKMKTIYMTRHILLRWQEGFPKFPCLLNLKLSKYIVIEFIKHSLEHYFL